MSTLENVDGGLEEALDRAEDALEGLQELDLELGDEGGESTLESLTAEERETVVETLEHLEAVVDQMEDIVEAIDLSELPDAIDFSELLAAIQAGEIPEAIADEDEEFDDAVKVHQLVRAINLTELWDATDLTKLWRSKNDLEEGIDELTDEDEGEGEEAADEDGVLEEAADAVDDAASTVTGRDEDGEGMLEEATDAMDEAGDEVVDEFTDEITASALQGDDGSFGFDADQAEAYQTMIQQQAIDGIDEFRKALLLTHEKFQKIYDFNREKMRRTDRGTNSRNPTAVSSMPLERADVPSTIRHTTVPQQVRHSSAPSRRRIYGPRFEQELEKVRAESERGTGADNSGN